MYIDDSLDFRPDIDLVGATKAGLFDRAAGILAAAVSAEAELLLSCSRNHFAPINRNRAIYPLAGFLNRFQVDADLRNCVFYTA